MDDPAALYAAALELRSLHLRAKRMKDAAMPASTPPPRPTAATRPAEEIARLGQEIYQRDIRRRVETLHHGEVVAIDVDTGSWAMGENVIAATDGLREKRPEAVDVWLLRVGHRTLHHFGGRPVRSTE